MSDPRNFSSLAECNAAAQESRFPVRLLRLRYWGWMALRTAEDGEFVTVQSNDSDARVSEHHLR
jgi:hypothetical protein